MKKEIIKIDMGEMGILAEEANRFIFKPSAEQSLITLHQTIVRLQELEEHVKQAISEAGRALNPNFKGVIGENVKCIFRKFGTKYEYDWKNKPEEFLKKKEYYSVNTDLVDKYIKEVGELPTGITIAPREEKLSIIYGEDLENLQLE